MMRADLRKAMTDILAPIRRLGSALNTPATTQTPPSRTGWAEVRPRPPREVIVAENRNRADQVRALFAAHYSAVGTPLSGRAIKAHSAHVSPRDTEITTTLRRTLSQNPDAGIREDTFYAALRVFDAIWPEGLAWPIETPRTNASGNKEVK